MEFVRRPDILTACRAMHVWHEIPTLMNRSRLGFRNMSTDPFEQLHSRFTTAGAEATIDDLIEHLEGTHNYHKLFDALMLKRKHELGAPLDQLTSLEDVPQDHLQEFRDYYIASARRVGQLLLDSGRISEAWPYFRTIGEFGPVRDAIESITTTGEDLDKLDEVLQIALYDGANPPKGLSLMLQTHGICNTITATEQQLHQMTPEDRIAVAALLVRALYSDLAESLRYAVEQRMAAPPPTTSVRELLAGRDWLFESDAYHVDVSHLNAVVRFARALPADADDLPLAMELAEYGSRLSPQFQYPGDPPFENFYEAHLQYFRVIADQDRDAALQYFRDKLEAEPDETDRQLIAYVLVDLLMRIDRRDEGLEIARAHLANVSPQTGFSLQRLCFDAERPDLLQEIAREQGDLVTYTAALATERS